MPGGPAAAVADCHERGIPTRAAGKKARPGSGQITAHPLNPPTLQFSHYLTKDNALAAGDTDVDVAAWAFSLLGHKAGCHTVKNDKLSFLLMISYRRFAKLTLNSRGCLPTARGTILREECKIASDGGNAIGRYFPWPRLVGLRTELSAR